MFLNNNQMKKQILRTIILLTLLSLTLTQEEDDMELITVKSRIKT